MPGRFAAGGNASANGTAGNSLIYGAVATAAEPVYLYDIVIGATVAGDNVTGWALQFITAENMTPGGTAETEIDIDRNVAGTADVGVISGPSGQPTATAGNLLEFGLNERASFRWVSAPGGEFKTTGAVDQGWSIETDTAAAAAYAVSASFNWIE